MGDEGPKGQLVRTVIWRRVDGLGVEHFRLWELEDGHDFEGLVVLGHEGVPWRIDYLVRCNRRWQTCHATINATSGATAHRLRLRIDHRGRWKVNEQHRLDLAVCSYVDLGFTPSTNTLAVRRLGLSEQGSASVRAAWVRFPELTVEVLEQQYTRTGKNEYRYESALHDFRADLTLDDTGLVVSYPAGWEQAGQA